MENEGMNDYIEYNQVQIFFENESSVTFQKQQYIFCTCSQDFTTKTSFIVLLHYMFFWRWAMICQKMRLLLSLRVTFHFYLRRNKNLAGLRDCSRNDWVLQEKRFAIGL